ncbi:MAG: DinB family protein [Pyrinomonadaceae bacterium]
MNTIEAVILSLENAPNILLPLVREIPEQIIKRRPHSAKWSVHEHAVHLSEVHRLFFNRLDLMLKQENPRIKSYQPDQMNENGELLKLDLEESLERFTNDRKILVKKLKTLTPTDWQRPATHEEYTHYSVFIMFRHLALHDNLHAYRIEEILLKKDWE